MRSTLFILCLLLAGVSFSQEKPENGAFAGGNGIFVFLSDNAYNEQQPNKGVTAIRIERKASGENNFQIIATIQSPADAAELDRRLEKSLTEMPFDLPGLKGKGKAIWEVFARHKRFDSLGVWRYYLPVQAAFGLVYYDKSAKPGISYTYQVVPLEKGQPGKAFSFNPTSYPRKATFSKLTFSGANFDGVSLQVKWGGKSANWPRNFSLLRQDKLDGNWQRIPSDLSVYSSRDSMYVEAFDYTAVLKNVYRYAIIPSDHYGNPGDTVFSAYAGAYDYTQVAPPFLHLNAGLTDDRQAVTLSWKIEDATMVSGIRIFRSENRDGPYDTLATVPANTITYVDEGTSQLKMLHYYLQCLGPLGEAGPASPRIFALPDQSYTPVAPTLISATPVKNGVELLIQGNDANTKGYRIYRQDNNLLPFLPITDLLIPKDATFKHTDSSATLNGKNTYGYSVKAEGKGFALSMASDTLFARPLKSTIPILPTGVSARWNGEVVQLYWDNMEAADESVSAYVVHRKELPQGKWIILNAEILPVDQNYFDDRTIQPGKRYAYALECYDYYGGKSGMGPMVEVAVSLPEIHPPSGVRAYRVEGGIEVGCDITLQDNLKSYNLYRYERGKAAKKIATIQPDELITFTDKPLTAGTLYFYYFTIATGDGRESGGSEEVGVRF